MPGPRRASEQRFSQLVHWGYGIGWGVARGLLRTLGLSPRVASVGHFVLVYSSEQVMAPTLDVAPPATGRGATEVGIDAWHHLVYVAAAAVAFGWLRSRGRR